jgi:hypothetical protein
VRCTKTFISRSIPIKSSSDFVALNTYALLEKGEARDFGLHGLIWCVMFHKRRLIKTRLVLKQDV